MRRWPWKESTSNFLCKAEKPKFSQKVPPCMSHTVFCSKDTEHHIITVNSDCGSHNKPMPYPPKIRSTISSSSPSLTGLLSSSG